MADRRDELADAITTLRELASEDIHPVLDSLVKDEDDGPSTEEVWNQLIEDALNET